MYGERTTERAAHPTNSAITMKRRLYGRVSRPDFIETMAHAVTATRRIRRMIRTGSCVVPPSISGAKTARPPRTTRGLYARKDTRAGMERRHDTHPCLAGSTQPESRAPAGGPSFPVPITSLAGHIVCSIHQGPDVIDRPLITRVITVNIPSGPSREPCR